MKTHATFFLLLFLFSSKIYIHSQSNEQEIALNYTITPFTMAGYVKDFRGPVRKIVQRYYKWVSASGEYRLWGEDPVIYQEFDLNGNLLKRGTIENWWNYEYIYDDYGNLLAINAYIYFDELTDWTEFRYTRDNYTVNISTKTVYIKSPIDPEIIPSAYLLFFNEDGSILQLIERSRIVYEFNGEGDIVEVKYKHSALDDNFYNIKYLDYMDNLKISETSVYDDNETIVNYYSYNDMGDVTEEIREWNGDFTDDFDNPLKNYVINYSYRYDEFGNWIWKKCLKIGSDGVVSYDLVFERDIEYWEKNNQSTGIINAPNLRLRSAPSLDSDMIGYLQTVIFHKADPP